VVSQIFYDVQEDIHFIFTANLVAFVAFTTKAKGTKLLRKFQRLLATLFSSFSLDKKTLSMFATRLPFPFLILFQYQFVVV